MKIANYQKISVDNKNESQSSGFFAVSTFVARSCCFINNIKTAKNELEATNHNGI